MNSFDKSQNDSSGFGYRSRLRTTPFCLLAPDFWLPYPIAYERDRLAISRKSSMCCGS